MSYIGATNDGMKKKPIQYGQKKPPVISQLMQEPELLYQVNTDVFSQGAYQHLQEVLQFTQAEWAAILHISDRTLQRYLKEGKPFTGFQAELLHQLKRLTETGLQIFDSTASFTDWLRNTKQVLGQELGFQSLQTITGIGLLQQELGRMAYGVYI